jgi:hypothetical protein
MLKWTSASVIALSAVVVIGTTFFGEAALAASACKKGQITCKAWCAKYRPEQAPSYSHCYGLPPAQRGCLNSGGLNKCVRDRYLPYSR